MSDTRILPDLQCSVLCEEIRQEANGNPMLIGVLTQLIVPQLPVTATRQPLARICQREEAPGMIENKSSS